MTRKLVPIAVIVLALSAAACSSNTSSTSSTTSTTTRAVTTTTPKPATTTTAKPATNQCSTTSLAITVGQSSGAAGHIIVPLIMKNISASTCITGGYPGVAGTNSVGTQVIQALRTGPGGVTITVAPGASASSLVSAVDVPSGTATSCPSLSGLVVTPPNTTSSAQVIASLPGCSGLSVTALVGGTTGQ